MNSTIYTILNHRSIRQYKDKDVSKEELDLILNAARHMPSSINGQQISIIVVKDKERKAKIAELSGGQPWIAQAPVFLVFVMDLYKTAVAAEKNDREQIIQESAEGSMVSTFDAGLAMGGAIIAAESLNLGIVPIGAIRKSPQEVIKLLELPKYTYPVAGLVIGHPDNLSAQKPRMGEKGYIHNETYNKEQVKEAIDEYDETMADYYKQRGDKISDWSSQVSANYQNVYFPQVLQSLKEQGFKFDK